MHHSTCAIRRATADDAPIMVEWRAQPSVRKYQPILQIPEADLRKTLRQREGGEISPAFDGKMNWIVLSDGLPCGWVSLTVVQREHRIGNVGYTIAEGFRGQKLAGRALRLVCDVAFDPAGFALERLEANCTTENIASAKTLEYAGFTREGIARGYLIIGGARVDHFRYARLLDDPMS
jgi:RimJ/RimL family protein N-acetyltransferase